MGCTHSDASTAAVENGEGAPQRGGASRRSRGSRGGGGYQTDKPMTFEQLRAKRDEFWSTRVTNNAAMWSTLQAAATSMLDGDAATGMAMVEAAGLRTPEGSLALSYDERGNEYRVPEYCFLNPTNLLLDGGKAMSKSKKAAKGSPSKDMKLRMRIVGHVKDYDLTVSDLDTVAAVKRSLSELLAEQGGDALPPERMRMIFAGKVLGDEADLRESGVEDGRVVQVFPRPVA